MNKIEFNGPAEGLSFQQLLWKSTGTFFYALRPFLLYTILPGFLMAVVMFFRRNRTADEMISGSGNFYYAVGILLTFYLLHRRSRKRGSSLWEDATLEYNGLDWKKICNLIWMGFGFGFFFSALITVFPFPAFLIDSYSGASNSLATGTDPLLALLSATVTAPIVEEIIFRGYMLNRLLSWFKEREAILITSVVFAICHVSPIWIIYAFLMGVFLAKVSIEEDNIAHSIALHLGFNMNILPIWIINQNPVWRSVVFGSSILIAIYGTLALGMAVYFYKRYRKETKKW